MPEAESSELLSAALALLDGEAVDWTSVARSLSVPEEHGWLRGLRALEPVLRARLPQDVPRSWGDLRILERIGSGAFGDVYRAWDDRLGREVALKLLRALPAGGCAEVLLDEARRLAQVKHPGIVAVHGAAHHGGRSGFWMELVRGRSFSWIVREQGLMGEG